MRNWMPEALSSFNPFCSNIAPSSPPDRFLATNDIVPYSPLLDSISHERPLAQITTAKEYRSALLQDSTVPLCILRITDLQWSMFWSFTLTAVPRNIVHRYIIGKIPHRSLLHRIIPQSFLSNMCPICCIYIEYADRLLFTCPSKANIWKAIIFEFLWPTIEIEDIIQAITSLDFSNVNYSQKSDISAPNIIFLTLAQIWKAHYRYIFDDTPISIYSHYGFDP